MEKTNRQNKINLKDRKFGAWFLLLLWVVLYSGCGTTKWSDTGRTATEQLLISSAIEDVIDEFDFYPLSGKKIYLKKDGVSCTDSQYLIAVLRQQLAANGVFIKDKEDDADYILEIAPGTVGTNRYELMYGISSTEIPSALTQGTVTSIPEVSLIKRTDQKAEIKLMLWAYNRKSGSIIWQSGTKSKTAYIRDRWFLGIGPITKTSFNPKKIAVGTDEVKVPRRTHDGEYVSKDEKPSVKTEAIYREIDPKTQERLQAIREKGTFRFTKEEEKAAETTKTDSVKAKTEDKNTDKNAKTEEKDKTVVPKSDITTANTKSEPVQNRIKQVSDIQAVPKEETPSATIKPPENKETTPNTVPSSPKNETIPANNTKVSNSDSTSNNIPVLEFDNMQLQLQSIYVPENQ